MPMLSSPLTAELVVHAEVQTKQTPNRSCRGADADSWPSYYLIYDHTWTRPSIDECKDRCLAIRGCRGIEYTKTSCKVWTRAIQSTVVQQGALCLRFGSFDPHELLDSFVAVHGGQNRACRGGNSSDADASYFTSVGPARAGSLEACKILCMRTSGCNAIQFSSSECQLWTRDEGVETTALEEGVQCLKFQPFRDFDGSQDRVCEAPVQPGGVAVGTLKDCQDLCYESVRCTGINFHNGICHVFTGEFSSRSAFGSRCSSFQPFVSVDGGVDRDCRGAHENDISEDYFVTTEAPTLEACKLQCILNSTCQGIAFSSGDCKVWTRSDGIKFSKFKPGSVCLRYQMLDSLLVDCAFKPVDGGKDRACRGANESDNLDSHFTVHLSWPENSSVESCQDLCQNTLGCKGIEFRLGACEIWMVAEGIQASVWAAGRTCMRYEPFESVDGFTDRVCRGINATDSAEEYFDIYSPVQAPTLEACQNLCSETVGCQGIEYRGWCEVWTRPGGITATAYSPGSQCLKYQPFVGVDGGSNRACRGSHPADTWSSYYELYGPDVVGSLDHCKTLCLAEESCKGIEYRDGRCEVWTRRAGIGSSAPSTGSMCLRKRSTASNPGALNAFYTALVNQTCKGQGGEPDYIGPQLVGTEEQCRALCISTPGCTAIDFGLDGCRTWTSEIQSSVFQVRSEGCQCGPGTDQACLGSQGSFQAYTLQEVPSLEICQVRCVETVGCTAVDFGALGCKVWMEAVTQTESRKGSTCLQYASAGAVFSDASAFKPIDGGMARACRGMNETDNLDSYFILFWSWPENSSMSACQDRCVTALLW
eukprot:Skav208120  [mRNA]  locus=scaffold1223:27752:32990:- [translate_table: standard]